MGSVKRQCAQFNSAFWIAGILGGCRQPCITVHSVVYVCFLACLIGVSG